MAHCPGETVAENVTISINASYLETIRKNLLNLSQEELQKLRWELHAASTEIPRDTYCDGWLKDVSLAYRGVHGYLSLAVCLFGTIANVLNIVVLTRKDMSSAPINKILTGLAVADMLVMVEYVPFAMYMIYEAPKKNFSYRGAVFLMSHVHFSQIMHTISICLTLTLAVWRYIVISHPQRSVLWCTDVRCHAAIALSYILPLFVCTPSYFITRIRKNTVLDNNTNATIYHLDLGDTSTFFFNFNFWVYAVVIKLLPCAILTVISCCLINALYHVNKRKQALKSYNACASDPTITERRVAKADRRAERTTKMLVAVLMLFLITEFPQGSKYMEEKFNELPDNFLISAG